MGRMTREEYQAFCLAKIKESRRLVEEFYDALEDVGDARLLPMEVPKVPYDEEPKTMISFWGGRDFRDRIAFTLPDGRPFQCMNRNHLMPDFEAILRGHDPSGREYQDWHRFVRRGRIMTAPCWNRFDDLRGDDGKPVTFDLDNPTQEMLDIVTNADWDVIQLTRDPYVYWPAAWQKCLPKGYKWTGPAEYRPWEVRGGVGVND